MSRHVYQHPDGPRMDFANGDLIAIDADNNTVRLPIGPPGLVALAAQLTALAAEAIAVGHKQGESIADWCLDEIAGVSDSESRAQTLGLALFDLQHNTTFPDQARIAFALAMESEIGNGQGGAA